MARYAFLGPAGTFSEAALFALGVEDLEPWECGTIAEVFEAVERGRVDGGVVPIENSIEGSVPATLDGLAFDTSVEIQQEIVLDIHHSLVAAPGVALADVTAVVAHPQASGQCRRWLERNLPGRPVTAANSNAEAVQTAVANPGIAALGPTIAAEIYGAEILAPDIEDYAGNQTRFVVLGHGLRPRTGRDKTSLALFEGAGESDTSRSGFRRLAFRVSGDEFLAFLEYGREQRLAPMRVMDHESQISVYFSDPYGHALELTTYDHKQVRAKL